MNDNQTEFIQFLLSKLNSRDYTIYNLLYYECHIEGKLHKIELHKLEDEKKNVEDEFNQLLEERNEVWHDLEQRFSKINIEEHPYIVRIAQELKRIGNKRDNLVAAKIKAKKITNWYKVDGDTEQMYNRAIGMVKESKVVLEIGFMFWEGLQY